MRARLLCVLAVLALPVLVGPVVVVSTPVAEVVDGVPGRLLFGAQLLALGVLMRAALLATAPQDPRIAVRDRQRRLVGPGALISVGAVFAFLDVLELGSPVLAAAVGGLGVVVVASSIRLLDRWADHVSRHHASERPTR